MCSMRFMKTHLFTSRSHLNVFLKSMFHRSTFHDCDLSFHHCRRFATARLSTKPRRHRTDTCLLLACSLSRAIWVHTNLSDDQNKSSGYGLESARLGTTVSVLSFLRGVNSSMAPVPPSISLLTPQEASVFSKRHDKEKPSQIERWNL